AANDPGGGEIVLLGLVALPQMLKLGYDKRLAIGTITAGGSLGTMIPPSIILIFYGITAEVSISELFLATLMPGLLLASLYIAYILVRCGLNPQLGPPVSDEDRAMPLAEKMRLFRGVALPVFVAGSVLVSIYAGLASIIESAAVGVIGTLIAAQVRGELSYTMLREALVQSLRTCGMVFWLVFGTNALIGVYNVLGGISFAKGALAGVSPEPAVVLLVMILVFILLGFFMDWIGILFLTMPVFLPTLQTLGYDPIWFGIVFNLAMQIAYLTPPFGPACFYLRGVAPKGVTLNDIFAAQWPFIGLQIVALVLVVTIPDIALWLPRLVYG
ncbi:MAG: TRAP transporter large permease subunit, partial [Pseudomonadota bacterium]